MKKITKLFFGAVLALGFAACEPVQPEEPTIPVTEVTLKKETTTLLINKSETLLYTITPNDATDKEVTWTSSDPSVATVNDGLVTAVADGFANITVASVDDPSKNDICVVTVISKAVAVEGVNITETEIELNEINQEITLMVSFIPENATNQELTWASSDENVVTVENGVVTAVGGGYATITATSIDNVQAAGRCDVKVDLGTVFTLATIPADGSTIFGDTWTITDSEAATLDNYAFLRSALLSAGREISLEFPNLKIFADEAFEVVRTPLESLVHISAPVAERVGKWTFWGCGLKTVNLPSLTFLDAGAFSNCSELEAISLEKVTEFGTWKNSEASPPSGAQFHSCTSLRSIDLPLLTALPNSAIYLCKSLEEVNLPKVVVVGDHSIAYSDSLEVLSLPELTTAGDGSFMYNKKLREVYLPKLREVIPSASYFSGLFSYNWGAMEKLTIATDPSASSVIFNPDGCFDTFLSGDMSRDLLNCELITGLGEAEGNMWKFTNEDGETISVGSFASITIQ